MELAQLLRMAAEAGASDLHLSTGVAPMMRVDGALRAADLPMLDEADLQRLLDPLLSDAQRQCFAAGREVDLACSLDLGGARVQRVRVNLYHHARGTAAALRLVATAPPRLDALEAPPVLRKLAEAGQGLILVTGATGSGKSTTLAAMVDHINRHRAGHIITIEDPVEFVHAPQRCLVSQREPQRHSESFATALRAALREDPDVILVGELRDAESIRLALTAAETGHLVLGTLHAASAPRSVDRIIDACPAGEQAMLRAMLAESLTAVIAQQLLPRAGGGRVAAHEVMVGTPAVRNLIRENRIAQLASALQTGAAAGMQTLAQSLDGLSRRGLLAAAPAQRL